MSKRPPKIYKACLTKVRFEESDHAIEIALKRQMHTYFCEYCHGYHLTKQKQKPARKPKRNESAELLSIQGKRIISEDKDYYYCEVNPAKRLELISNNSQWEATDSEVTIRIKKSIVAKRIQDNLRKSTYGDGPQKEEQIACDLKRLRQRARASMRNVAVDPIWMFETGIKLLAASHTICIKSVLVDLATVGAALNDCGEYERGQILLEAILRRAETIKDYRAQFVAIEGLALSAFYLGNRQLSRGYLDKGLALAMQLNKQRQVDRFKNLGENHVEGMTTFPQIIRAPAKAPGHPHKKRQHSSTGLKKGF